MKKTTAAARILLGLVFLVFGLNAFLHFIHMPPPQGRAAQLMAGFAAVGYFFPLLFGTQVVAGALLLVRRFVPLALLLLAPIVVNIVAFHLFCEPSGLPLALAVLALEIFLAWSYRGAFQSVLHARDEVPVETGRPELRPRTG